MNSNLRRGSDESYNLSSTDTSSLVILSVSEESHAPGTEILRGVYPERSEWAQNDKEDEVSFSYNEPLEQYVGINGLAPALDSPPTV